MSATSSNSNTNKLTESSTISTTTDILPTNEHLKKRSKKDYNNNKKRPALYTVHTSTTNPENSKKILQKSGESGYTRKINI